MYEVQGIFSFVLSGRLKEPVIKMSEVTFTAKVLLQHWHLMITSACVSLRDDNFSSDRDLAESQALLLQTGH